MKKLILLALVISSCLAQANTIVTQTNIFSGEVASNLTVSEPLVVSATGKITTGLTTSSVNSTSASAVAITTTDVLIATMTLTPAAGTYLVFFTTTLQSNTNNINIITSIYAGGSQIVGTELQSTPQFQGGVTPTLNVRVPVTNMGFATVNGSQAIEARWRGSAAVTATAGTRILGLVRM